MDLSTIVTHGGLGICTVLLVAANWSSIQKRLPQRPRPVISQRPESDPTALIEAYHVARDACDENTNLAQRTDQVFQELICQKVLRCEK